MAVRLIAFATKQFQQSAGELAQSALRFGLSAELYTPQSQVMKDFARAYPDIARLRRGAGYWLWKPWLIKHALATSADGDVIVYADAGSQLIADPAPLIELTNRRPVAVFGHGWKSTPATMMRRWTKRDCFVLLGADREEFWNARCCTAGFQIYRNSSEARAFADELLVSSADPRVLTDIPNTMGLENFPEFVDHRHDQSVLSILALRHNLPEYPDPTQYGAPHLGATYGQIFDHHRHRSAPAYRRFWLALRSRLRRA
jgi:hypothetical protein